MADKWRFPDSFSAARRYGFEHPNSDTPRKNPLAGIEGIDDKFAATVEDLFEELALVLLRKHADYGPYNIAHAPGGALNGLRVRMHDKLARLNNLVDHDRDPNNESLRDTLLDLANYAAIGVLVLDGKWPK